MSNIEHFPLYKIFITTLGVVFCHKRIPIELEMKYVLKFIYKVLFGIVRELKLP